MKFRRILLPVVMLGMVACVPVPAEAPPVDALAAGVLEMARSRPALDDLVTASLRESDADKITLTLAELAGRSGEVEFFLPAQTLAARLTTLTFEPHSGKWLAAGSLEVAGLDAQVGYVLATGDSGECRLRLEVGERELEFLLSANPEKPALDVGEVVVGGEPVNIEFEPTCPLATLPLFAEQLGAALDAAVERAAQPLAERAAETLAGELGADADRSGTVSSAWAAPGWGGSLGYSISPPAGGLWLGRGAAGVRFTGGFWSQASGCLPPGTVDLPAQPVEPGDLDSLLAGQPQAVAALAVSDSLMVQAVLASWRAGLFCRALEAGALPGLRLDQWLPSAAAWPGRETRLLLTAEATPLVGLAGGNPGAALPAVEISWPRVRFDFYLDAAGADLRVLSVLADLDLTVLCQLSAEDSGLTLENVSLGRLEIAYSEPLLEDGGVLRRGVEQLLVRALQILARQLPPWPVSLPAGTGSVLAGQRRSGRSVIFLGP